MLSTKHRRLYCHAYWTSSFSLHPGVTSKHKILNAGQHFGFSERCVRDHETPYREALEEGNKHAGQQFGFQNFASGTMKDPIERRLRRIQKKLGRALGCLGKHAQFFQLFYLSALPWQRERELMRMRPGWAYISLLVYAPLHGRRGEVTFGGLLSSPITPVRFRLLGSCLPHALSVAPSA